MKKIILIFLVTALTSCAKPQLEKSGQGPLDAVGNMGAISGMLTCMFAPSSKSCEEAKAKAGDCTDDGCPEFKKDQEDWDQVDQDIK